MLEDRFWTKVQKTDTCWLWTAAQNGKGYGVYTRMGRNLYAHREAYTDAKGAIPSGLVVDHLCRVRHCVNPDHLEAVSHRENCLRGEKTYTDTCGRGHSMADAYVLHTADRSHPKRQCRTCTLIRSGSVEGVELA